MDVVITLGILGLGTWLLWKNVVLNTRVLATLQGSLVVAVDDDDPDQAVFHRYAHDTPASYLALRRSTRRRLWLGWVVYGLALGNVAWYWWG
jgi:hypothetical protein